MPRVVPSDVVTLINGRFPNAPDDFNVLRFSAISFIQDGALGSTIPITRAAVDCS